MGGGAEGGKGAGPTGLRRFEWGLGAPKGGLLVNGGLSQAAGNSVAVAMGCDERSGPALRAPAPAGQWRQESMCHEQNMLRLAHTVTFIVQVGFRLFWAALWMPSVRTSGSLFAVA